MKSLNSRLNSPDQTPSPSAEPEYSRKSYRKFLTPTVPVSPLKLPPIYSPEPKNYFLQSQVQCSRKNLQKKLSLYIDLGLTPKIPLSHKNLMKFKNAKKKTITLSDFMSKSVQKQLIETSSLSEIKDEDFFAKQKNKEREFSNAKISQPVSYDRVNSRRFDQGISTGCRCYEDKKGGTRKRNLKTIEEIVGSCERLLKKKVGIVKGKSQNKFIGKVNNL